MAARKLLHATRTGIPPALAAKLSVEKTSRPLVSPVCHVAQARHSSDFLGPLFAPLFYLSGPFIALQKSIFVHF